MKRHPNFKNGEILNTNGYLMTFVGKKHHLADVRGYAYNHRIVAESKYNRQLKEGEQVHHIDGNRLNNDESNIEIHKSKAHHFFLHRKINDNKKHPDEKNIEIECLCGCGNKMMKYDKSNRPRSYISGHNPVDNKTEKIIYAFLRDGINKTSDMVNCFSGSKAAMSSALHKMVKGGKIKKIKRGEYGIK